jgi:hypothetical protein
LKREYEFFNRQRLIEEAKWEALVDDEELKAIEEMAKTRGKKLRR